MNVCIYDNNYISITKYIKRLYNVYTMYTVADK